VTASLGDLTQIPVTTFPTQGLPRLGDVNVTLYNQDLTNVVYISYQHWFAPGSGNCVPIQPLTSITISAKRAIYIAASVAGVQPLMVLPEGSQAQPSPAQIAAQINTLGLAKETTQVAQSTTIPAGIAVAGVPALTKSTVLSNIGATVVAAGGNLTSGQLTVTQPTYEIYVTAQGASSTEARPWITIRLTWVDSTSGQTVETQQYSVAQSFTSGNQYHGVGPVHADRVTVQVFNLGTTQNCTVTLLVLNNSLAQTELWRSETIITNAPNGFGGIAQAYSLPNNILFMHDAAAVGAGATDGGRGIAFYCGIQMEIRGNTSSNTNDMELFIRIPASLMAALGLPATAGENVLFDYNSDAKGLIQQTLFLPRVQCEVAMTNHNAAAKDLTTTIMGSV